MNKIILVLLMLFYIGIDQVKAQEKENDSLYFSIENVKFKTWKYDKNIVTPIMDSNPFEEVSFLKKDVFENLKYDTIIPLEKFINRPEFFFTKADVINVIKLTKYTMNKKLFFVSEDNKFTKVYVYYAIE